MPPARRGCLHCGIWREAMEPGVVLIACAHCKTPLKRLDLSLTYDQALIKRQVASSKAGHSRSCKRRF